MSIRIPTLVALVVQVNKVRLPVRGQGRSVDGITVVLAGDVAATGAQVQSRDVVSPVTVLELDGAGTGSQSQQLVAQTDTEDGDLGGLHQTLQVVDGVLAVGGVTRAVGDKHTIEVVSHLVDGEVEGEDRDAGAAANQAPQDILFHTAVDDGNVGLRVRSADVEGLLGADLTHQVNLFGVGEGLVLVGIVFLANGDTSEGRTLFTQVGDDGTGVDTRDGRNTLTGTPLAQGLNGSPVAVLLRHIGNNHTGSLQVGGLEVLQEAIGILLSRRHTVVTDQRLGEDQDLATVGWVGQGLGVPDQRGGEHSLAGDVGAGAKGLAGEHGAITDGEGGRLEGSTLANSGHETGLSGILHGGEGRAPGGHCLEQIHEHFWCMYWNAERTERDIDRSIQLMEAFQRWSEI